MSGDNLETSTRLYQILCIADFSSQEEVKRAYKQLALKYHPDKNLNDPSCVEKFREVRIAYEVLSNSDKKKKYDISLKVHKAATGMYGRAAMRGANGRASAGQNPYMSGGMNANIYEELKRQQQRRTASRTGGTQTRTASTGASSATYTREQQELFRKRERERQAELKRQMDREHAEAREKEREQKRREQERQEELLQQRWRQQQAAYAAAAGAQPRSARRPAGGGATTPRTEWRTGTPPPQQQQDSNAGGGGSSLPRCDSATRMPGTTYRNSPTTPRSGTPGAQRSTSAVRRGGAARNGTPLRRGESDGFRRNQSSDGLSFQNLDAKPFMKGRTPRARAGSPTPSASTGSRTPPPQSGLDDHAPRHSPAFPVNNEGTKGLPNRRRTFAPADDASGSGGGGPARRNSSLGGNAGVPLSPGATRRAFNRNDSEDAEYNAFKRPGSAASSQAANAKAARTAAALHAARSSASGQKERQRQRDLRAQEQELELQRIIRARKQLEKERQEAEAANIRADPQGYFTRLLELCTLDEESERDQLIEKEEMLARRRISRSMSISLNEVLYGPAIRLLFAQEEDHRAAVEAKEHSASFLIHCCQAEAQNRQAMMALERRNRKQMAGREANELYFVQRSCKLRGALVGQEAQRRKTLEQEAYFKVQYLFTVMGPEFFGRMRLTEEEGRSRTRVTRTLFPEYASASASPTRTSAGRQVAQAHYWNEDSPSLNATVGSLDEAPPQHPGGTTQAPQPDAPQEITLAAAKALEEKEARHRVRLSQSEESAMVALLKLRANQLRACYEKAKKAAVAEATREAMKEIAQYKLRVAKLERALAKASNDTDGPSPAPGPQQSGAADSGVSSPPMRVCTPSSLGESPRGSDEAEAAPARPRPVSPSYTNHRDANNMGRQGGGAGRPKAQATVATPSSTTAAPSRTLKSNPRITPPLQTNSAAASNATSTTEPGGSINSNSSNSAGAAPPVKPTGTLKKRPEAVFSPAENPAGDEVENTRPPQQEGTTSAVDHNRNTAGINLARYFPRWRESPKPDSEETTT